MLNQPFINKTLKTSLPLVILTAISGSQAYAQEGGAAVRGALEEIVVTARRTEESLQSVPVSVTAFSGADIRKRGITSLEDVQLATPGVHLSGSGGRSNPVYMIRGQSKALSGTMSPAVVTYFDEVPEPNYGSYIPQFDLGSIQVLKGPQGTLFGRNTTGGAILYTAAAPDHELGGYVSASLGNYDLREYEGAVNLPLVQDKLAVRLAGITSERDGYSKDRGFNRDLDDDDYYAYRVSLLWTPTDNISNTLMYNRTVTKTNGDAIVAVDFIPGGPLPSGYGIEGSLADAIAHQDAVGPRKVINTRETFDETKKTSINNRTEIQFGDLTLVNIFGYRDVELNYLANSDGLPSLIADGSGAYPAGTPVELIKGALRQELEQYTNEIQLMGNAFDDKLDWRLGAYWMKSEPTGPMANWVAFAAVAGTEGRNTAYNFQTEESRAVFAHGSYDLGDLIVEGLELEVGVRYSKDEVEACTGTGINSSNGVGLSACERGDTSQITAASVNTAKSDATTWSVGLNWQVNDEHFLYVVSRRGYRSGGINSPSFSGRLAQFQSFAPEKVTDVELGVRSDWYFGGTTVRTNISTFLGKYEDVQAPLSGVTTSAGCAAFEMANPGMPVPPGLSPDGNCSPQDDPAGNTLMMNMGKSEVSGIDAEIIISPVDNLTFNFGMSYLDTETKSLNRPDALAPYMTHLTGISFNYVARKTATAAVNYTLPVGSPMLESINFHGNLYWTDDISFAETWMIPSYTVTNYRVDFQGIGTPGLELGLWVRNAADKDYISAGGIAGPTYGMNAGIFGPPRMYGAELRYNF